jgi:hypothetical protein
MVPTTTNPFSNSCDFAKKKKAIAIGRKVIGYQGQNINKKKVIKTAK